MLQHVSQVIDADLSGSKGSLPNLFLPYGFSKRQNFESSASASFIETNEGTRESFLKDGGGRGVYYYVESHIPTCRKSNIVS